MAQSDPQKDPATPETEPELVDNGEAEFEYLRMQIIAFEGLKGQYDLLEPYYGYDDFKERKYKQRKDMLESGIERRYQDIISIAQDVLKQKFEGNDKARIVAMIVKAIGGLETKPPQFIDRTDRINVLR